MKTKNHTTHYSSSQGRFPEFFEESLEIDDVVFEFDRIMEEIKIGQYLKPAESISTLGRPGYNRVKMLKTVLFAMTDTRDALLALREIEDRCKVNLRYRYLMDRETPSYRTFGTFIAEELSESIEDIFKAVMAYICEKEHVDLQHVYIDGSKLEANANRYSFVWKKGTEKQRYRLYGKITAVIEEMNETLQYAGVHIAVNTEYSPEGLDVILKRYKEVTGLGESEFVRGRGHHKSVEQRSYEKLRMYREKLAEYVEELNICGPDRDSYSKTDRDATFMRMKRDHMGNDQLLPGYNVQIAVADEYIAAVDVQQYRSDMDCFIPLMEKFKELYGIYPKYPVADAGYGSFNNYIFCHMTGMEKYMKFPMYQKETKDEKYRNDPFRAVNFKTDADGDLICPNGRKFKLRR